MVEDLDAESRFPQLTALLRENRVRSWCAVPLTTALRRLGAMGFGSATPRRYEDADVAFLQQVANQVAVTVDNVLHHESAESAQRALEYKRDRLQLLLEVTSAVVSHLNLDDVFAAVSACLRRVIPHDGSSLLLFEPDTGQYRIYVLKFAGNGSFVEEGRTDPHNIKSPAAVAITTRRPALFGVEELERMAPESKAASRILAEGIKSFCAVPLLSHDRVLGALNVGSARPDAFSESDVELLRQVAQQVAIAVENAVAYREIAELKEKLNTEKLYLEAEIRTEQNFDEIVGKSPALTQVLKQIEIVAPTESTVLIQGETGTGKELLARAIHNLSARRARTFVKLNCAAIPTGLLESELFGHERGAFTGAIGQKIGRFELAQRGNPVPRRGRRYSAGTAVEVPARLARTGVRAPRQHPDHPGGHRLVAATNRDLTAMVAERQFRSDLYYRLNVFPIVSPPLRDRHDDVAPLVRHFTQKFARRMNKRIETISADTMDVLSLYHWPGNVRELENLIERAVILSRGSTLEVPLAELRQRTGIGAGDVVRAPTTLKDIEREHIRQALQQSRLGDRRCLTARPRGLV